MSNEQIQVDLILNNKNFKKHLKDAIGEIDNFRGQTNKANASSKSWFSNLSSFGKLGFIGAIAGSTVAIKGLVSSVIETSAKFEDYHSILTNLLGSQEQATASMNMLKEAGSKVPFTVDQLTESYKKMVADGFQPTQDEMIKMSDLSATLGKDITQYTEAILDAQRFENERLKEFGISASVAGDKVSYTFRGQTTVIDKNSQAIRNYLLSLGDVEGIAGTSASAMEGYTGKVSNLSDTFDRLKVTLGKYILPIAKKVVSAFSDVLDFIDGIINKNDSDITKSLKIIGVVLEGIGSIFYEFYDKILKPFYSSLSGIYSWISTQIEKTGITLATALANTEIALKKFIRKVKQYAGIVTDFLSMDFKSAFKVRAEVMSKKEEQEIHDRIKKSFNGIKKNQEKSEPIDINKKIKLNTQITKTTTTKTSSGGTGDGNEPTKPKPKWNDLTEKGQASLNLFTGSIDTAINSMESYQKYKMDKYKQNAEKMEWVIGAISVDTSSLDAQLRKIDEEIEEEENKNNEIQKARKEHLENLQAIEDEWLAQRQERLDEKEQAEFEKIDLQYNQEIELLANKFLSQEEQTIQKEAIEEERRIAKEEKRKELEAKEEEEKANRDKKLKKEKETAKKLQAKEDKEEETRIETLNKEKERLQLEKQKKEEQFERDRERMKYMIGLQSFVLNQKTQRQTAKMNLASQLSGIAAGIFNNPTFSAWPLWAWALVASQAAIANAQYQQNMNLINGAFYPPLTGFSQGGLVEGALKGIDSVPAMLQPGELVVPEKNFDDVVRSFSNSDSKDKNINVNIEVNVEGQFINDSDEFSENLVEAIKTPLTEVINDVFDDKLEDINL